MLKTMKKLFSGDRVFYGRVLTLALPIALQSLITIGVNMLDTIMVGTLGEVELSATSLANQFINIYHIFCMGLGMGASVMVSRYWGMRESEPEKSAQALKKTICIMVRLTLGLALAFAIATKWTGVYAGAGLAVLFIWYTLTHFPKKQTLRLFLFCCLFFVAIPLVIYTLCFIPVVGYTQYDNLIDKTIQGTLSMFDYHYNLEAEHYYSSPFYEWPVIWMPLLDANDIVSADKVSSVSCMGNPLIWWAGIPCVLYVLFSWIFKKDKKAGFLVIAYLAQYVPWMPIKRITFIYHYFPAILFVILMMGYTMADIRKRFLWGKKAITIYLVTAVICFFLFFPVLTLFLLILFCRNSDYLL